MALYWIIPIANSEIMKKLLIIPFLFLFVFQLLAQEKVPKKIHINNNVELTQLKDSFFIHTTYYESDEFGRFPSNGMLLIRNGKALMIDTPMTEELTNQIYGYLKSSMNVEIVKIIVGHYHDDCLGGLEYLHNQGVESIALDLTLQKCIEYKLPIPKNVSSDILIFDFEGEKVICQYFGGGHTIDNIVVYFPSERVLFGGCLIKSLASRALGNTADAVVSDWKPSIQKLINEFPDVEIVIPGHGQYGNAELLKHTMNLVDNYTSE